MGLFPFYYHKLTLLGQALKINKGIKKSRKKRHIETSSLGSNQKTKCCNYADFEDLRMQVYSDMTLPKSRMDKPEFQSTLPHGERLIGAME